MANSDYIYKPNTRKGPVFIDPKRGRTPPQIRLSDGRIITAVPADRAGGTFDGHEGTQFVFPSDILGQQGAVLIYNGQEQPIGSTNMSYRGTSFGSLSESSKGAIGSPDMGAYTPGQIGYGATPADLTSLFPNPFLVTTAPYKFTDIEKFAKSFGAFNRKELQKNFKLSQDLALKTLDTELEGMQNFVPAASALKRNEIAIDNIFNQMQRTQQVDMALPGMRESLQAQTNRANAFASGRVPDEITDRAFELTSRSNAADIATQGGFGQTSSVARKTSDLYSADRRVQLSQYGDQLLGQNVATRSALELAPTSYSDAGQQVRVMPSLSASQLTQSNQQLAQQATIVPASQALQSEIQQQQYSTSNEQQTRLFNASSINNFALTKFGYQASLAGTYAGALQTDINTQIALEQQKQYMDFYKDSMKRTQDVNSIKDILSSIGTILGGINSMLGEDSTSQDSLTTDEQRDLDNSISSPVDDGSGVTIGDSPSTVTGSETPEEIFTQTALKTGKPSTGGASRLSSSFGGAQYLAASSKNVPQQNLAKANTFIKTLGFSTKPEKGYIPAGYGQDGKPIYVKASLANSKNINAGKEKTLALTDFLKSVKVLDNDKASTLQQIGAIASDANTILSLTEAASNKDFKSFANTLANATKRPLSEYYSDNPKEQAQLRAGITAAQLFTMWDRMSPAQKSLGVATLGIEGYEAATGQKLGNIQIIKPEGGMPGITVGQAFSLANTGYNVYSLMNNWKDMNTIQRAVGGTMTAANIAETARSLNLLGTGSTGAVVPGVTASSLAAAGFTPAPALGVGAIVGASGASVPAGYTAVASSANGGVIAVPTANMSTTAINAGGMSVAEGGSSAVGGGVASGGGAEAGATTLGQVTGPISIAAGVYTIAKNWGAGGAKGALTSGMGGAAIVAGLSAMGTGVGAPIGAAIIAAAAISGAVKVGKSGDQQSRDAVRNNFVKLGLTDKDGKLTLADGTLASIGIDGHGNMREWTDKSKVAKGSNPDKKLNAWDIDYTNDLDFTSGMMGISLSRLASGGAAKNVDQVGGNIGNAALMGVGFGKQMTRENFEKVATNMRGMYAKIGVADKASAYQLANQAYSEGRISASELVAMHQSFNMMYDRNGYDLAQRLMKGRQQGVELATDLPDMDQDSPAPDAGKRRLIKTDGKTFRKPIKTIDGKRRVDQEGQENAPEGFQDSGMTNPTGPGKGYGSDRGSGREPYNEFFSSLGGRPRANKEALKESNRMRYGGMAA